MGILGMDCSLMSSMTLLYVLGAIAVAVIVKYFISPLWYWKVRNVPSVSAVPILGSMTSAAFLTKSLSDVYADIYKKAKGKKYVGFVKFVRPSILMADPELIKNTLNRDFDSFHSNDVFIDEKVDPMFGKHIFALNGERWKKLRASLSPGFSSGKMKGIYPLVCEVSENLNSYMTECLEASGEQGWATELKDLCARFTTDVIASIAFGLRCDSIRNPNTEFRSMGRKILEPTPGRALLILIMMQVPKINEIFRVALIPKLVTNFFRNVVLEMVTKREREGIVRNDYIQLYTQLWKEGKLRADYHLRTKETDEKNGKATTNSEVSVDVLRHNQNELDDITAQAVGVFGDGFETSSTLISFTLFELAHHQQAQERLRQEIEDSVTQKGPMTYDTLQELTYLDMVIQETLRIYPPAGFLSRLCTKRYRLPNPEESSSGEGVWLEEGTPIVYPVYALHHDAKYFPDPETFDPDRFSSKAKKERPISIYTPFGDGPRVCIGQRLGLLQTKVAVANIISRFQLVPHEKTSRPIVNDPNSLLTASKHGLWVTVKTLKAKTA